MRSVPQQAIDLMGISPGELVQAMQAAIHEGIDIAGWQAGSPPAGMHCSTESSLIRGWLKKPSPERGTRIPCGHLRSMEPDQNTGQRISPLAGAPEKNSGPQPTIHGRQPWAACAGAILRAMVPLRVVSTHSPSFSTTE